MATLQKTLKQTKGSASLMTSITFMILAALAFAANAARIRNQSKQANHHFASAEGFYVSEMAALSAYYGVQREKEQPSGWPNELGSPNSTGTYIMAMQNGIPSSYTFTFK